MITLSHDEKERLETLFDWDLSQPIKFLVEREGMDQADAERRAIEYKRYMATKVLWYRFSGQIIPISEPVDAVWHTHMLFPRNYEAMCLATRGAIVNHQPTFNAEERRSLGVHYLQCTLPALEALFGTVNSAYWPADAAVCLCYEGPADYTHFPRRQEFSSYGLTGV